MLRNKHSYTQMKRASLLLMCGIAAATTMLAAAPVMAASTAPTVLPQHATAQLPDAYSVRVGDVRVTALSDGSVPQDLHKLLHRTTIAHIDALLARAYQSNPVEASLNAFLFRLPKRVVLVDTGAGALFGLGNGGKLLGVLASLGVSPDQVTDVPITHAHDDHSGGLISRGQRVFVNATVHVGKPDVDFFFDMANQVRTGYDKSYFEVAQATLKLYQDAGKLSTFTGRQQILPGVTGEIHAGHTPGSAFYILESRGEHIIFVGDIVHNAAVQFADPTVTIAYDEDETGAARVRAETFATLARTGELVAVHHLSFPGIGRVRAAVGGGYDWVPVVFTDRDGQ